MLCFVFRQKTAYEMRISDWSSDVCSSDLVVSAGYAAQWLWRSARCAGTESGVRIESRAADAAASDECCGAGLVAGVRALPDADPARQSAEIGRASCRERVCQYV